MILLVPILESPNVFSMLVPEGWSAMGMGDLKYELTKAGDESGAVHVSGYRRADRPLGEVEARDLVEGFLKGVRPESVGDPRILAESEDQHRAVMACQARDPDTGVEVTFLVFLVLWRTHFILCSCNAPPGSPMLDEAERMFASIHRPEDKRKGRWRR